MAFVRNNPAGYLAQAQAAEGTGNRPALDCRATQNYGYLFYKASGHSAIFNIEASHDLTAWMVVATYTATATQTGTAQLAGYFPYMRANLVEVYSAAGGSGVLWAFYAPGLV